MGVSFETCLRRRGDVLIGRHCDVLLRGSHGVPIRRLGDVPRRHRWVFHLGVLATSLGRTKRRRYDVATTLPQRLIARWVHTPHTHTYTESHLGQSLF